MLFRVVSSNRSVEVVVIVVAVVVVIERIVKTEK
jgi:hypothetical protein